MKKLAWIIILATLISFTGCATLEKNQLKAINEGKKPSVAVVTSISDQISFTLIGLMVFLNTFTQKPSSGKYQEYVQSIADSALSNSKIITYVPLPDETLKPIRSNSPGDDKKLSDYQIKTIADFGKGAAIDYILIIKPSYSSLNIANPNRIGGLSGIGVFDDSGRAFLYAYLEFNIIDTANAKLTDQGYYLAYQSIPVITRILSEAEYKLLEEEWVIDSDDSLLLSANSSFEEDKYWMAQFLGKDYKNMETWQADIISKRLLPVTELTVNNLLAGTGLSNGRSRRTASLKESKERLWPLMKSEIPSNSVP